MDRTAAAPPPQGPTDAGNLPLDVPLEWIDNGRSLGFITFAANGTAKATWIGVPQAWRFEGSDLLVLANGTQWVTRLRFDPGSSSFHGTRDRSSQTQDGVRTT